MWDLKWANATEFVDEPGEDLGKYGLAPAGPPRRVTVWLKKGKDAKEETKSFLLGPLQGDKAYGRLEGERRLFAFSQKDVEKILRTGFHLSDRRLVRFEKAEDIARVEARFPGGREVAVRRSGDNWVLEKAAGKQQADQSRVGDFIGIAEEMESQGEAPPGETADFENFRVSLKVVDVKGKTWGPIVVGAGGPKDYLLVRVEGSSGVLRIRRDLIEKKLPSKAEDWIQEKKAEPAS